MCIANASLNSMLKIIGSDIITAKINKSLQLYFRISCFYDFVTKTVQNKPNLFFPDSKHNMGIAF